MIPPSFISWIQQTYRLPLQHPHTGLRSYPSLITMVTIMGHAPTDDRGIPQVVRTAQALPRPLLILMDVPVEE
jgi:hypothetical protein